MSDEFPGGAGVPSELLGWMERYGGVGLEAGGDGLTEGAFRALDHAAAGPRRGRETAFALLAADALMTEAVERLFASEDPGVRVRALVERLASGGGPGAR